MAYIAKDGQGNEIVYNGKKLFASDAIGVVKGIDPDARTLRIVASDETADRDGDIVRSKGWKLENYIKNPVFIWAHDYRSVPLAAAIKIERKRGPWRLVLTHKFPPEGINPFADMIFNLYKEKIINAGSVGFIPEEWKEMRPTDADVEQARNGGADGVVRRLKFGREFLAQELLEHSGCPVPANPSALQESVKAFESHYKSLGGNLMDLIIGKTKLELDDKTAQNANNEIEDIKAKGVEVEEETPVQVQVPEKIESNEEKEVKEEKAETPAEDLDEKVFTKMKALFDEVIAQWFSESVAEQAEEYKREFERLLKAGAVLNKKNKARLKQAAELISEVLKEAETEGDQDETGQSSVDQNREGLEVDKKGSAGGGFYDALLNSSHTDKPLVDKGSGTKVIVPAKPPYDQEKLNKIVNQLLLVVNELKNKIR